MAIETTIDVRGRKVAARVWGPEKAPPILALHGWLDNAASFDQLAPLLPDLRIVAVDLPGHGYSDRRAPGVPYHYVDWVTEVTAIADGLGWECFSIMGHSMGAGIACLFAGTYPSRVQRLVLLDGLGPLTAEPQEAPERLALGVRRMLAAEEGKPEPLPSRHVAAEKMRAVVPGLTLRSAETLLERGMRDVPGGVVWRADPRLRVPSLFRFTAAQVHAFLKRIECPVLVVRGVDGYSFDVEAAREQLDCMQQVKVVRLRGGHHVHLDDAPTVAPPVLAHFAPLLERV